MEKRNEHSVYTLRTALHPKSAWSVSERALEYGAGVVGCWAEEDRSTVGNNTQILASCTTREGDKSHIAR